MAKLYKDGSEVFRQLLNVHLLTPDDLAASTGYTRGYIYQIQNGKSNVSLPFLKALKEKADFTEEEIDQLKKAYGHIKRVLIREVPTGDEIYLLGGTMSIPEWIKDTSSQPMRVSSLVYDCLSLHIFGVEPHAISSVLHLPFNVVEQIVTHTYYELGLHRGNGLTEQMDLLRVRVVIED